MSIKSNNPDGTIVPTQARAKQTYENILMASQVILEESGIEALNSNYIVERAGVTAPVFYRYFKNKHSLLTVLGKRLTDAQNKIYVDVTEKFDKDPGGLDSLEEYSYNLLIKTYEVTKEFVGAHPLLVSLRAIPDLSAIRLDANREMAEFSAAHLRKLRPELSHKQAYDRCRLAIEIGYSAIEMLLEEPDMSRKPVLRHTAKAVVSVYAG